MIHNSMDYILKQEATLESEIHNLKNSEFDPVSVLGNSVMGYGENDGALNEHSSEHEGSDGAMQASPNHMESCDSDNDNTGDRYNGVHE
jgi:hypothetical protein